MSSTPTDHIGGAVRRLALRGSTVRRVASIQRAEATEAEKNAIARIMLVEASARPSAVRVLERVVALVLDAGVAGARGRRRALLMTLGPLQLRGATRNFDDAVAIAVARLRSADIDVSDNVSLARFWNGPAAERCSVIPYSQVLGLAEPHAARLLEMKAYSNTEFR